MWEKINDYQLRQYLMSELERFHEQPEGAQKRMKAAITIGRQPGSNIYVFDTGVEVSGNNHLVKQIGLNTNASLDEAILIPLVNFILTL